MSRMPLPTDPRQLPNPRAVKKLCVVPTIETRSLAHRMILDAETMAGPDAALRTLAQVDAAQVPALIGLLLTATKLHKKQGRPALPLWFSPEERREGHRLYKRGDRTPWVVAAQREYQRANQRSLRARGGA